MRVPETNEDNLALGLQALAWTLRDDTRAERLIALTGLTVADLRARLGDPAVLDAVLGFLEAHEPDLIACAQALGVKPQRLIVARHELNGFD